MTTLTASSIPKIDKIPVLANDELAISQGCYYDDSAAERIVQFFEKFLRHSKGQFQGKRFKLLPWQEFEVIRPLYGWKKKDGSRRFRHAHIEVVKKVGKSTLCSGLSLYHLIADKEPGAEIINASGSKEQASIVFNEALNMVDSSPQICRRVIVRASKKEIVYPKTKSWYKVIASDAKLQEGLNCSAIIIDELHTFTNRKLWDTLYYAGAMRRQPLTIVITTAGDDDETTLYADQHRYAESIIEGIIPDTEFFAYIRKADPDDDIQDPKTWEKACPSIGETISYENYQQSALEAVNNPNMYNSFLRYRLNIRASKESRWLPDDAWQACEHKERSSPEPGDICYGGMDLSHSLDIGGYLLYFPEKKFPLPRLWAVRSKYGERAKQRTKYEIWERLGLLTMVDREALDYKIIKDQLDEDDKTYNIKKIGCDPWNAVQFSLELSEDGYTVEKYRQGYSTMTGPMKEIERMVMQHELVHHGNQILRWMLSNVVIETDINKNIRPAKKKSQQSIDGIVMLIMALGLHMIEEQKESVYARRGILRVGDVD